MLSEASANITGILKLHNNVMSGHGRPMTDEQIRSEIMHV